MEETLRQARARCPIVLANRRPRYGIHSMGKTKQDVFTFSQLQLPVKGE